MSYFMTASERIESFARRSCPRAILTSLLDGKPHTIEEFRCLDIHGKQFCIKSVRTWVAMLEANGYLQSGVNFGKDARRKQYRIPEGMLETVEDLLRRIPEDECPRL